MSKKHELTCTKCGNGRSVSGPWFYKLVHQFGDKTKLNEGYKCPTCNRSIKAEIKASQNVTPLESVQA